MMLSFQQERYIKNNRCGVTENLCMTKAAVDAVGHFNGELKFGGDHKWGHRVADAYFALAYAINLLQNSETRRQLGKARAVAEGLRLTSQAHRACGSCAARRWPGRYRRMFAQDRGRYRLRA